MPLIVKNKRGFSLIEILVAAFLITIVITGFITIPTTTREDLEQSVSNIERAVRFATDEASLRNAIVRIHLFLDKAPQEYAVEVGPNDSFVLPLSMTESNKNLSLAEMELRQKKKDKVDKQFNRLKDFQDKNFEMPETVRIIAVGNSISNELISDLETSIHVYPSGEKDAAIIIFASNQEVISLTIDAFTLDLKREYVTIEEDSTQELSETQLEIAKDLFEKWLKNF